MGSHIDRDHCEEQESILERLKLKAELMTELGENRIAQDRALSQWKHDGIQVVMLPDDPEGVLRISIGAHPGMDRSEYCNFRGDQNRCIKLLERCLDAMKSR